MLKLDQQLPARRELVKTRKKNFLPTLVLTLVLYISVFLAIILFDPNTPGVIPVFLAILFLTFFFSFSLVLANKSLGLLLSSVILSSFLLRLLGVPLEIAGLALLGFSSLIIYFSLRRA